VLAQRVARNARAGASRMRRAGHSPRAAIAWIRSAVRQATAWIVRDGLTPEQPNIS
jgi:hypothetical protein